MVLCFSLQTVQSHALLCINNLVTSLEADALGGVEKLHKIWLGLLQASTPSVGACLLKFLCHFPINAQPFSRKVTNLHQYVILL